MRCAACPSVSSPSCVTFRFAAAVRAAWLVQAEEEEDIKLLRLGQSVASAAKVRPSPLRTTPTRRLHVCFRAIRSLTRMVCVRGALCSRCSRQAHGMVQIHLQFLCVTGCGRLISDDHEYTNASIIDDDDDD